MRKERKCCRALWMGMLLGILGTGSVWAEEQKEMDVVFTHDLHSYLNSYEVSEDGVSMDVGGLARLKTLLDEKREENPDTLVVDAGDFSMGTLFHTIFSTEAVEYRMLGQLGFDATTLGNHEFDFGSEGLADMMEAAAAKSEKLPPLVICNVDWNAQDEATERIHSAGEGCGLADYTVVQKGDTKVAILGVLGKDALMCAPTCELTVLDPVESVKKTVQQIQEKEEPDLIVCISHGGTWEDEEQSEDEILAKEVPQLDLIVSGHTHTALEEPIVHGDTTIVSCGAYGRYTGTLSLEQQENGRWALSEYRLVSMDEEILKDREIQETLDQFNENIDEGYLDQFGFSARQVLAENEVEFEEIQELDQVHTEHALGNIISDSYRYTVDGLDNGEQPVDVAVVPSGVVRGTYLKGDITVTDVFDSFSLGNGPDQIAGYPLISVYLTGAELRTAAEVDASISDMMTTARLYMSGMSFSYNPHRMILNKVTDVWLNPGLMDDTRAELEKDKLYRVVADLYTGRMLGAVSDKSFGILKLVPKFADGTKVENFEDCIIYDKEGKEVKAWTAIANYMSDFEKNSAGASVVPAYYETDHGRKVVEEDKSLGALLKNPSKYAWMICGVLLAVAVIAAGVIVGVVKLVKRLRKKRKK